MFKIMLALVAIVTLPLAAAADPHDVFGTYVTESQTAHIEVGDCGDGSPCGKIIWFDTRDLPPGETMHTYIGRRGTLVLGSTMLEGFKQRKRDWRGGTLYNGENGKTYAARLKRLGDGTLQVKGCVGPICSTQIWQSRAEDHGSEDISSSR